MGTCYHCGIDFQNEKSAGQKILIVLMDGDVEVDLEFHPSCFHEVAGSEYYDELLERRDQEILKTEAMKSKFFNTPPSKKGKLHPGHFGIMSGSGHVAQANKKLDQLTVACEDCGEPALDRYCQKCIAQRVIKW